MNPMRAIRIEKVTLNIGVGKDQSKLDNALALLKSIAEAKPVKTVTNKRLQEWGLRPGLPIGCKVTLRGMKANNLLPRLLGAKDMRLKESQFDGDGNISFGIPEYIDIEGVKYDPKIGIMGLQVCVKLKRAGYRISKRRLMKRKVPKRHKISREEAIEFMKKEFNVKVGEE
jgi:large subunit ribosomal protein L5